MVEEALQCSTYDSNGLMAQVDGHWSKGIDIRPVLHSTIVMW